MDIPRVSIIILNWNGWRDTIECLESVYRITYPNYDVIVVDNGSNDDSIAKIKEYAKGEIKVSSKFFEYNPNNKPIKVFEINEDEARQGKFNKPLYEKFDVDKRVVLIKNKDNYGFAGGNNIGIKFALSVLSPDYVLLLNNDTIVGPNFLSELVKVAESNGDIGVVGPRVYYYDYNGRSDIIQHGKSDLIASLGTVLDYELKKQDNNLYTTAKVSFIYGASMLIRANIFLNIGLLEENFFLYWEETDFCYRVLNKGHDLIYVPSAKIFHKLGGTEKNQRYRRASKTSVYFFARNIWLFARRNLSPKQLLIFLIAQTIRVPIQFINYVLFYNSSLSVTYLKGTFDGIVLLLSHNRKVP